MSPVAAPTTHDRIVDAVRRNIHAEVLVVVTGAMTRRREEHVVAWKRVNEHSPDGLEVGTHRVYVWPDDVVLHAGTYSFKGVEHALAEAHERADHPLTASDG